MRAVLPRMRLIQDGQASCTQPDAHNSIGTAQSPTPTNFLLAKTLVAMSFILNTLAFRKRQGIEAKAEGRWLSGASLLQRTLENGVPFPCRWKKGDLCWKYVYCPDESELEPLEERVRDGEAGLSFFPNA